MKLHFHDWSRWSAPFDTSGDYIKCQTRHCLVCGKVTVGRIKQPWSQFFSASTLIKLISEIKGAP